MFASIEDHISHYHFKTIPHPSAKIIFFISFSALSNSRLKWRPNEIPPSICELPYDTTRLLNNAYNLSVHDDVLLFPANVFLIPPLHPQGKTWVNLLSLSPQHGGEKKRRRPHFGLEQAVEYQNEEQREFSLGSFEMQGSV